MLTFTRFSLAARHGLITCNQPDVAPGGGTQVTAPAPVVTAPVPTPPAGQQAAPAPVATAPVAATTVTQPADQNALPADIAVLHKMIGDLRAENASERVNAKTAAADEARTSLIQELGKALGLVEGEAPSAEELATQVAETQASARQSAIELAVFQTASAHGGNPSALTDSRAFLAKVADLDPGAEDFTTKVTEAAKAAVTENASLKAVQATTQKSTVEHPGGTGEKPTQPASLASAVKAAYATQTQ